MEASFEAGEVASSGVGSSEELITPDDKKFHTIHVVAYILAAVIARQYSGWQIALAPGFGAFIIGQVLTAMGCVCHYLCLLEIWSAVPFSGGSYALSRATLGFFVGFLDGCIETFVYIGHTSLSAIGAGNRICIIFDLPPAQGTLYGVCFYGLGLALTVQKSKNVFKDSFIALAVIGVAIIMFYVLGMLGFVDFAKNASLHRAEPASAVENWFQGGGVGFMAILPYTLQPYAGIRSFTLLTSRTVNPKVTLSKAVIYAFGIIIFINLFVVFVFPSQPGGIEQTAHRSGYNVMAPGWEAMFGLEGRRSSIMTNVLQLPATFSRVFAYMLPAGVMLQSMARSNLLPSFLMINKSESYASVVAALFGMGLMIVYYYYPIIELLNLTVMGTMVTDIFSLYGFVLLKTTYSNVPREFVSPLGLWGAAFSFGMYLLIFISAAFYQNDYFGLEFYACFLGACSIYYYVFARKTQTLNDEEDHVFFKMHVRNFNMARKNKRRYPCERKKKASPKVLAGSGDSYEVDKSNEVIVSTDVRGSHNDSSQQLSSNQVTVNGYSMLTRAEAEDVGLTTRRISSKE